MKYLGYYCVVGTQAFLKGHFSSLKYMVPPLSFGDSHKDLGLPSYKKNPLFQSRLIDYHIFFKLPIFHILISLSLYTALALEI